MKTNILILLDNSGSMNSVMPAAIETINTYLDGQKELSYDDYICVTLSTFNTRLSNVYQDIPLHRLDKLRRGSIRAGGGTSLRDSIADLIDGVTDTSSRTIVIIQTDGSDNSSRRYSTRDIASMVGKKRAAGWQFNFIGMGIGDDLTESYGRSLGIDNIYSVSKSLSGMDDFCKAMTVRTTIYRANIGMVM